MELKLGANIQAMRRERGLTQEQLATAMGVTVGAVSKWEKGSCCPDVQLIPELAEFFGTSVDVLLGYGWEQGSMGRCAEHIRELLELKRYDEGIHEAAKALTRYPNSFPIVYRSGKLYLHAGFERHDAALVRQAQPLLERALQLISQNDDERISALSIHGDIGSSYICLGEFETALDYLRRHNDGRVNDREIGFCLHQLGRIDEAMVYFSDSYLEAVAHLFNAGVSQINCLGDMKRDREALELADWLKAALRGLLPESGPSFVVKMLSILTGAEAVIHDAMGEEEASRKALCGALAWARRFDAEPTGQTTGIRFYYGEKHALFDDSGTTAMEMLRDLVAEQKSDTLTRRFEQVLEEERA